MLRRQGWAGSRWLTFSSDFPFFQVFGFPANKLWISWSFFIPHNYHGLQLVLADPCACSKYHCCQPDLQACAGTSMGLGLKASLGDFLPLIFARQAQH